MYSDEDVENFIKIKALLYTEGYSIPGAKKVLKEMKAQRKDVRSADNLVDKELLKEMVDELHRMTDLVKEI